MRLSSVVTMQMSWCETKQVKRGLEPREIGLTSADCSNVSILGRSNKGTEPLDRAAYQFFSYPEDVMHNS